MPPLIKPRMSYTYQLSCKLQWLLYVKLILSMSHLQVNYFISLTSHSFVHRTLHCNLPIKLNLSENQVWTQYTVDDVSNTISLLEHSSAPSSVQPAHLSMQLGILYACNMALTLSSREELWWRGKRVLEKWQQISPRINKWSPVLKITFRLSSLIIGMGQNGKKTLKKKNQVKDSNSAAG